MTSQKRSFTRKRSNRYLSIIKRGISGLFSSSHDKNYLDKLERINRSLLVMLLIMESDDSEEYEKLFLLALLSAKRYRTLSRADDLEVKSSPNLFRTIDSFEERQYWGFFNTTREDLHELYSELLFPTECKLDNGAFLSGEEVSFFKFNVNSKLIIKT